MKSSYHKNQTNQNKKIKTKQKKTILSVQKRSGRGEAAEPSERLLLMQTLVLPLPAKPLGKDDRKPVLRET